MRERLLILPLCLFIASCGKHNATKSASQTVSNQSDITQWLDKFRGDPTGHGPEIGTGMSWEQWINDGVKNGVNEAGLLGSLQTERLISRRRAVVLALRVFGSQTSVPVLIGIINGDEMLRVDAISTIGCLGSNEDAVTVLCDIVRNSADVNVRANAYMSLGRLGGLKAEACLRDGVNDPDRFVRDCVQEAQRLLKERPATEKKK